MTTEFDRLFNGFAYAGEIGFASKRDALVALVAHVRTLEADAARFHEMCKVYELDRDKADTFIELQAKAAKFDALVAACEREDAACDEWNTEDGDRSSRLHRWVDASEARKAAMK